MKLTSGINYLEMEGNPTENMAPIAVISFPKQAELGTLWVMPYEVLFRMKSRLVLMMTIVLPTIRNHLTRRLVAIFLKKAVKRIACIGERKKKNILTGVAPFLKS